MAAVAVVALIVWWTFFYRKSVNGIISRLNTSRENKSLLREYAQAVISSHTKETIEAQAEADGLPYNVEVVDWALNDAYLAGKISKTDNDSIYNQLYNA